MLLLLLLLPQAPMRRKAPSRGTLSSTRPARKWASGSRLTLRSPRPVASPVVRVSLARLALLCAAYILWGVAL